MYNNLLLAFSENSVEHPEEFIEAEAALADRSKLVLKALFDRQIKLVGKAARGSAGELHVDGFDAEQVWQQIRLLNRAAIARMRRKANFAASDRTPFLPLPPAKRRRDASDDDDDEASGNEEKGNDEDDDEEVEEDSSDDDAANLEDRDRAATLARERDGVVENYDGPATEEAAGADGGIAEGSFFSLDHFDKFAELEEEEYYKEDARQRKQEAREKRRRAGVDESDELDEAADEDEEDDEEVLAALWNSGGAARDSKATMYATFFDPIHAPKPKASREQLRAAVKAKATRFERDGGDASDNDVDGGGRSGAMVEAAVVEKEEALKPRTKLDARRAKMDATIAELESEALAHGGKGSGGRGKGAKSGKPWQLRGEAVARERPENSLLEVHLDHDRVDQLNPVITVGLTQRLEEMIKQRIRDEAWDDPERCEPRRSSKEHLSNADEGAADTLGEKSKVGLGAIYEREFMKQLLGDRSAEERKKKEQKSTGIFMRLSRQLDALCNFHFTPEMPGDGFSIESTAAEDAEAEAKEGGGGAKKKKKKEGGAAAISMEEVVPLTTSDATLRAPGEIYKPQRGRKGVIRGESELTKEDRKVRSLYPSCTLCSLAFSHSLSLSLSTVCHQNTSPTFPIPLVVVVLLLLLPPPNSATGRQRKRRSESENREGKRTGNLWTRRTRASGTSTQRRSSRVSLKQRGRRQGTRTLRTKQASCRRRRASHRRSSLRGCSAIWRGKRWGEGTRSLRRRRRRSGRRRAGERAADTCCESDIC